MLPYTQSINPLPEKILQNFDNKRCPLQGILHHSMSLFTRKYIAVILTLYQYSSCLVFQQYQKLAIINLKILQMRSETMDYMSTSGLLI